MEKYDLTITAVISVMANAIIAELIISFHSISSTLLHRVKLADCRILEAF